MLLHLLTDEKFTDYAIEQFAGNEFNSKFILIPSNGLMHIVKNINKIEIINQNSIEYYGLIKSLDKYNAIIFHGMHWGAWESPLLANISKNIKVAWVFWGGDLYGRSDVNIKNLAPLTKFVVRIREFAKKSTNNISWEIPRELFKRVDYCLSDELEEYNFAKGILNNEMKFHWYNYYSLEETLGNLIDKRTVGNNILIGNSATKECNYFDILFKVKSINIGDRKIVLPLSYGSPWIRNLISNLSKFLFKNVIPLCDFLNRNEYNERLLNCNTMIMAHYYPQAQGNIITGLWLGMKVYLSEKNMTYHYFKRIGCHVYSIEKDLNRNNKELFQPEKEENIKQNREILSYWYSKDNMKKRNLELVKLLNE